MLMHKGGDIKDLFVSNLLFSQKLKSIRIQKSFTREFVFKETGIHIDTLRRIEKGESFPRIETLSLLSKVYNTNLILLLVQCQCKSFLYEKVHMIDKLLTINDEETLKSILEEYLNIKLDFENDHVSELFNQFITSVKDNYFNPFCNKEEIINTLLNNLKKKNILNFESNNIHVSYLEKNVLYFVANLFMELEDYNKAYKILKFLDGIYGTNSVFDKIELPLNLKVKFTLSHYYYLNRNYKSSLEYADEGIQLCINFESFHYLAWLLYRKGVALYYLNDQSYNVYFKQLISLLQMIGEHDLAEKYTIKIHEYESLS